MVYTLYFHGLCLIYCFFVSQVIVNVSDENDNAPYFLQNAYSFEIEENAEETILLNITAVDIDSGENGRLSYSLVNNTYGNTIFMSVTHHPELFVLFKP